MIEWTYWRLAAFGATVAACSGPAHHAHHGAFADPAQSERMLEDPQRDEWQKPDEVLRAMQLAPSMTVADVGAGTGYFSVRLARAVPDGVVIATDVEPKMVEYVAQRARREQLPNIRAARATTSTSGLAPSSVDAILVVNVWHHIDDRAAYARDLAVALKPGGRLFVVDFTRDAKRGPPQEMRVAPDQLVTELTGVGLHASVSAVQLPDQYIVEATREAR
ncbi:MAG TPA: class I SAM-dependent methyltransferase [Kofleriaceae bacterium]|jgi:cyclopropane fatty-acyl-phospholipid synthase-like methyltransferase